MKRRALFVGVENYDDDGIQNLRYAIDDAAVMSSAFRRLGFETTCLRDRSQREVLDAIADSTHNLHAGDLFLFFFSGHGFSVGSEDLVFCPEDRCNDLRSGVGAGMSYAKLKARTEKANDQFDRVFFFDTCRSYLAGARGSASSESIVLDDGQCVGTRDLNPVSGFTRNMSGSVYVLRSCSSGQLSLELPDEASGGRNGNGLFTKALLSVLKRNFEGNRPVSLNDVFYQALLTDMKRIKSEHHRNWAQIPEFACAGETLCLWKPENWTDSVDAEDEIKRRQDEDARWRREEEKKLRAEDAEKRQRKEKWKAPDEIEAVLDEAIRHMQFLCGSATVALPRNRDDKDMGEKLGAVRIVFYNLDRTNKRGKRTTARYGDSELAAMAQACRELKTFLQDRIDANHPAFLARECRSSVGNSAKKLLGTRYAELAQLMLECVEDSED